MKTTRINYFQLCIQLTEWVDGEAINRNHAEIVSLYNNDYTAREIGDYLREKENVK